MEAVWFAGLVGRASALVTLLCSLPATLLP